VARIQGKSSNDWLTGTSAKDTIEGLLGDDTLDGGLGADYLAGGAGNDVYYVDNVLDVVYEAAGEGIDTVYASVGYTLGANVENLVLTGFADLAGTGNSLDNRLTGNSGANTLTGGDGNDTLDGGAAADRLLGGAGDDSYLVDNPGDVVVELAGGGVDTVFATVSHVLAANVENLVLAGTAAIDGTGNSGSNLITGNAAANMLSGGGGADTLAGAAGDDTYMLDSTAVVIVEAENEGRDTVRTALSGYVLGANVENLVLTGGGNIAGSGNSLDNVLTGNSGANTLSGGDGNDTLDGGAGADSLIGGAGDDTYIVDDSSDTLVEAASAGTDTVRASITWTLGANFESLLLTGSGGIDGSGNSAANLLTGNSAANRLDGGAGADTMAGLAGDDTYVVDNAGDIVIESVAAGNDLVLASVSYTLAANVENLTLTGSADIAGTGNDLSNRLAGNSGANALSGGAGNDTLDGGAGADALAGGAGDDLYLVDNAGDVVVEMAAEGSDTVQTSISWTLADNVENLILTGTAALAGTGNELDNRLLGNSGANTLLGGSGNDTLDGGAGADSLVGGLGDDTYVLDNVADLVVEGAGEGIDTVQSSLSWTLGASSNLENLVLLGSAATWGVGNSLANRLTGNAAANTLTGGAGDDTLDGGTGADSLLGGTGDDTFYVDQAGDILVELAAQGTDSVVSSISYVLGANLENLVLTGSAALSGTGNDANNRITGNAGANSLTGGAGDDTLDGGAGADSLAGGEGNDTYVIDNPLDVIVESGAGVDTVVSSLSYTLGSNLENLTLTGSAALTGTGNASNNILIGNAGSNTLTGGAGNDTLDGGAGADSMVGGAGNDLYFVDNPGDSISETGTGIDTVMSIVSFTLGGNVENLILIGAGNISATGNSASNTLLGNEGDNWIDGRAGGDYMAGGKGDDTYVVDQTADLVVENTDEGRDKVLSSVTYTLTAWVEDLELTGAAAIGATGNGLGNVMTGNLAANLISGGDGNDTLDGAGGRDSLLGGDGQDSLLGGLDDDTLDGGAGNDTLYGGLGADSLRGGAGDDFLSGDFGDDVLTGGAGSDTFMVAWGSDSVTDLSTGDALIVSAAASVSVQVSGDFVATEQTQLVGIATATLTADAHGSRIDMTLAKGAYTLVGGAGADTLVAGALNDSINGGQGADSLYGGDGDDWFGFATGDVGAGESLDGGAGTDVVYVASSTDFSGLATGRLLDAGHVERILIAAGATATFTGAQLDGQALVVNTTPGLVASTLAIVVADAGQVDFSALGFADLDGAAIRFHAFEQAVAGDRVLISGGSGAQGIVGTSLSDSVLGGDGADSLAGGLGDDTLEGGDGNDQLDGGAGADSLLGGSGDDRLLYAGNVALGQDQRVDGGSGNDSIVFSVSTGGGDAWGASQAMEDGDFSNLAGIERIVFADGDDTLDLSSQASGARVATANLTVEGAGGNDVLDVTALQAAVTLDGGAGNDMLTGSSGYVDSLIGGDGNDTIMGCAGLAWDYVDGGSGTDTLAFDPVNQDGGGGWNLAISDAALTGIEILDLSRVERAYTLNLNGTQHEGFVILCNDYGDIVVGGLGADSILGGGGADSLAGDTGADTLLGGAGNDTLVGAQDDVLLDGGDGSDLLRIGAGFNDSGDGQIVGIEAVVLTASGLSLNLGEQSEGFAVTGYASGASTIAGGSSADSILGGSGNDSLSGNAGADIITGGSGADTINLGADAAVDTLVYTLSESGGADRISAFVAANDIVRIDAVLKAGNGVAQTVLDSTDDITGVTGYQESATSSTLSSTSLVVYNLTASILSKTLNGNTRFSASTDAAIVTAAQAALEDTSSVGGKGLLSGAASAQVGCGAAGTDLILALNDGENVALLRYQEGSTPEASYAGELTLIGVLNGVVAADLSAASFFA